MRPRLTFRTSHRITLDRDFARLFSRRCSVADAHLVLYVAESDLGHPRIGFRVGKRHGGAVVRNREKRRLREAFRLNQHDLPAIDMICVLRSPGGEVPDYEKSMRKLATAGEKKLARARRSNG